MFWLRNLASWEETRLPSFRDSLGQLGAHFSHGLSGPEYIVPTTSLLCSYPPSSVVPVLHHPGPGTTQPDHPHKAHRNDTDKPVINCWLCPFSFLWKPSQGSGLSSTLTLVFCFLIKTWCFPCSPVCPLLLGNASNKSSFHVMIPSWFHHPLN